MDSLPVSILLASCVLVLSHVQPEVEYDLEEDFKTTAQEEFRSLSQWLLTQDEDATRDVGWRPGGVNALCPPQGISHLHASICDAPICSNDVDCAGNSTAEPQRDADGRVCCYNGCVNSCVPKMLPPPAFDWLDETPNSMQVDENWSDSWLSHRGLSPEQQLRHQHVETGPDVVALPGGCVITLQQYTQLEQFKKNPNIKHCFCNKDGVQCEVVHELS